MSLCLAPPLGLSLPTQRRSRGPGAFALPAPPLQRARLRLSATRSLSVTRAVAAPGKWSSEASTPAAFSDLPLSGLNGQALRFPDKLPTKAEVLSVIPEHCFKRDTVKSLAYAAISVALTVGCGLAAYTFIPLQAAWAPAWIAYALVNGTIATGAWVAAHECGHGAFSNNRALQDAVGYALHSALLVPYFSWQRSHAVHHAKTNHVSEGESHCPYLVDSPSARPGRPPCSLSHSPPPPQWAS